MFTILGFIAGAALGWFAHVYYAKREAAKDTAAAAGGGGHGEEGQ